MFLLADGVVALVLGGVEYETVFTVDDDEVDADEFSSSNCCTCRMSTYSSSWFCDDGEVIGGFERLP